MLYRMRVAAKEMGAAFSRCAWTAVNRFRADPIRAVIVTSGRSGSGMLLSMLNAHGGIRMENEPTGEVALDKPHVCERIKRIGMEAYLDDLFRRKRNESVAGFKSLYYQIEPSGFGRKRNMPEIEGVRGLLLADPSIRIIHLVRRHALASLVSAHLAGAVKTWVLFEESKRKDPGAVHLTPEQCEEWFVKQAANVERCDRDFSGHPFCKVAYEDLTAAPEAEGRRLQEFLGVPVQPLKSRTLKQNLRSLRERVENYDQLKEHFRSTPWKDYFEE